MLDRQDKEMKRPVAPCKGCDDRELGCHSKCDRYKQFCKDQNKFMSLIAKEKGEALSPRAIWGQSMKTRCRKLK